MQQMLDVAVAGAGPAGSALAAFLAERGFKVALLDRAKFPRPKPCAEYLSPEAARVLDRLGVLDKVEAESPAHLHGMRVVGPGGTAFTGRFAGARPFRGYRDYGLALPREVLDTHLVEAAVARGAMLHEQTMVEGVASDGRSSCKLLVRSAGRRRTVTARAVVGADGLNSRVAQALGVVRRGRRRRVALVRHATGVSGMTDVGEMHVEPAGYVGLAQVGGGLTNVAVVVDLARTGGERVSKRWFQRMIRGNAALTARMERARFVDPVRAVGPFARWTTRATGDRVLLVGDAADFYDPFTGEGIYAALRGAELAARCLTAGLERDRLTGPDLVTYDRARRREFGAKWIVERLVSWAVVHPRLFDRVAARFAREPRLADTFVGVTGDFVPAMRVLRPAYLWKLVW